MNRIILCLLIFCSLSYVANAQVYSDKVVGKKNEELRDSLMSSEYPYVLPILGKKATAAGFELPYSAGLGINYLWQESEIVIDNLKVGVNNSRLIELDEIVRFNNATATTQGLNFRPDIWLLPFLNVYGIVATSQTSTEVDFSVFIPNQESFEEVFRYKTKAEFDATTFGFGITPTIGIGGGWLALDMNFSWTDIQELERPAFSYVFGPRLGKTYNFKKKDRNISAWVGGFRVEIRSDTQGSIQLEDVLPQDGSLGERIDSGLEAVETRQQQVDDWWESLTPAQQRLNQKLYDRTNELLGNANELLTRLDDAVNRLPSSSIQYSLDKRQKENWNFIIGAQYQHNKHWMIRGEVGFLGERTQFIGGLQYRFGL
ncbi:hypothetical protein [Sediminitomix flava]|uniref:Outer membrane protein with beta-barrel domain n=1 Tax=Sediminitomix flava TaxID=379075 RepID=A0A315ZDD0_SEDFL|nr:hypothetical protein [Sediminitomix flava]PWJ42724.1 hypothetical protein BC781_102269 [Sediminitomix flava]